MDYYTHLMEGFDLVGSNTDLIHRGFGRSQASILPTGGRFGDHGLGLTGGTTNVLGFSMSGVRNVSLAFWWGSLGSLENDQYILSVEGGSAIQGNPGGADDILSLRAHADGRLEVSGRAIDSTFPVKTLNPVVTSDTWYHIEVIVDFLGSTEVHVDEFRVLAVTTGVDTTNPAVPALDDFSVAFYGATSNTTVYDDIVARASPYYPPEPLKKHHIHTLLPDGVGNGADWTGTYADIDDPFGSSDGDSTYISSSTNLDLSNFTVETMPVVATEVHGVQVTAEARNSGTGVRSIKTNFRGSGATQETTGEFSLSNGYTTKRALFGGTSKGFWGPGALCGLQIGVKLLE